jgi:hypothetical protein
VNTHIKQPNEIQQLSPFHRMAAVVRKPTTRAGQHIRARFPVPPGHADLIAALAGLGSAVDQ